MGRQTTCENQMKKIGWDKREAEVKHGITLASVNKLKKREGSKGRYSNQVVNQAGAHLAFHIMRRLGVSILPSGRDATPSPPRFSPDIPVNSPVPMYIPGGERGIVREKYFAQEHNTITQPGLKPETVDSEFSILTRKQPRLPTRGKEIR